MTGDFRKVQTLNLSDTEYEARENRNKPSHAGAKMTVRAVEAGMASL